MIIHLGIQGDQEFELFFCSEFSSFFACVTGTICIIFSLESWLNLAIIHYTVQNKKALVIPSVVEEPIV